MNEIAGPDLAVGGLVIAVVILYSAWQAHTSQNRRDASLLAVIGSVSLMGSFAFWLP